MESKQSNAVPVAVAQDVDPQLLADLVDANHILFHENVLDAFGHVSVRHDKDPNRFLLARNLAPALVEKEDIMEFDLDGNPLHGDERRPYLERFIHGEIYRARPDVMAVVHSHSPSVIPFTVVKSSRLRPICHMCGFLGRGAPIFDIRDYFGDGTDLLIRNKEMGAALARDLGKENVVLMRGHGSTTVAPSLRLVVFRAIYTEVNARLQSTASAMGPVTYLTEAEAEATLEMHESQLHRPWNLWKAAAQASREAYKKEMGL